jgi:glucose uptake protein GlcU
MQSPISQTIQRMVPLVPVLLVLIGAIVLSVMNWNRHRRAAVLTFAGGTIQLLVTGMFPFLFAIAGSTVSQAQTWNMVFLLLRAIGMGLIVAAVFVGRETATRGFSVDHPIANPPPIPSSQHG